MKNRQWPDPPVNSTHDDPDGSRWGRLSIQVLGLIILPATIIVLVVAFGSTSLHQNAMRALVGERDERAVRTVATAINAQLLHRADLIQSLAVRGGEQASLDEVLDSSAFLDQEFDIGLAFFSADGSLLASKGKVDIWETFLDVSMPGEISNLSSYARFTKAVPFPSADNYVVFVYAAAGPGNPIAVGAFSVASVAYHALIGAFNPGEHASAVLVDSDQKVMYTIGEANLDHLATGHPGLQEALAGKSGATFTPVLNSEHVIAYSHIPLAGWAVLIEEPWESVTNPLLNTTQLAPLILVPVLLLAVVALWLGARQIVQPLQSLEAQAVKLAWGDFEAIEDPVGGIEEINRLQRTLIHLARKVQSAQQALRGYIGAITTGQEEERRRLARELHDDTIQSLIALDQRVQLTRMSLKDENTVEKLAEIQALTEQTINDLRRITRDLRPLYLEDLGLVSALDMLAREASDLMGIPVDFRSVGMERRFSAEVELALYRIAQEGLSNISKHARAAHASMSIQFETEAISLTIADDGCGFVVPESPAEFAPGGHFGLLGLHERAELIGARLDIFSNPNRGTRIVVLLPTGQEKEAT